jgi:hypothetical protein
MLEHRELRALPLAATLERGACAAAFASTLAASLLAADNGLEPFQRPLTFGLAFWGWLAVSYLGVLFPALAIARLASVAFRARWPGLDRLPEVLLAVLALVFLWTSLTSNGEAVAALLALGEPARYRRLLPVAAGSALVGLLTVAWYPLRSRIAVRLITLVAITAGLGALYPGTPAPEGASPALPDAAGRERLLVVGFDGADWTLAEQMMAQGELPALASLRARGSWGRLETLQPTNSPEIWTTVFTGFPPERHGIVGFTRLGLRGVRNVLPQLDRQRGTGFDLLEAELRRYGVIREVPVNSDMRRVPAYWNVASAYGQPLNVVSIWPTWPAEEIRGTLVTERIGWWPPGKPNAPRWLTHPEQLYEEIAPQIVRREDLGPEVGARFVDATPEELRALRGQPREDEWDALREWDRIVAQHETTRGVVLALLRGQRALDGAPWDTLVYFDIVDKMCHMALHCSELVEVLDCSAQSQARLGGFVSESYRTADAALGELMDAFGEGNVIVLSDHGWQRELPEWTPAYPPYTHRMAPPGIFVAAGPAFRAGELASVSVFDVLPLLLRVKGFALARDLPGRVPEEAFTDAFVESNPVAWVASYGDRGVLSPVGTERSGDAEVLEQLRGLGYIE